MAHDPEISPASRSDAQAPSGKARTSDTEMLKASPSAPNAAAPPPGARAAHLRLVSDQPARLPDDVRRWAAEAVRMLADERARSADTPLVPVPCPELPGVQFILKDESQHPSGSLKHRLAQALFVQAIASGEIGPDTLIVEASSGSSAIAEAWFARKLGLRFVAVVPATTAAAKLAAIRAEGGEIMLARPGTDLSQMAAEIAREMGGHHMDQFGRAAEAPDWRTNNIAQQLIAQLDAVGLGTPAWIVAGAGTGGTAATIGRYLRLTPELAGTRLCVVDPEGSAYFAAFTGGAASPGGTATAIVEGIGRGRVAAAFLPHVIDHMVQVSDEGSVSGAHWLARRIDRRFGPSTGTNMIGALILGQAMVRRGETGTIALVGCDDGARYGDTIYDAAFCGAHGLVGGGWSALLTRIGAPEFPAAY